MAAKGRVISTGIAGCALVSYGCIVWDGEHKPAPAAPPPVTHTVTRTVVQHAAPALSGFEITLIILIVVIGAVAAIAIYMNSSRWRHLS